MAQPRITIRPATTADSAVIAHHRVAMFRDMDRITPDATDTLTAATITWLAGAIPRGEYLGWLAAPSDNPRQIVAGAGVQLRRVLPFPLSRADGSIVVAEGRQAIVVNVYTEETYRRRGIARQLMETVLAWARDVRLESLVLHAAPDGKHLYEQL